MVQTLRFGTETLPIHPGRYRLVVSPLCPFCRRATITYRLLQLDAAIALTVGTSKGPDGFVFETPGYSYDTQINARTSRELYRRQPDWEPGQPTTVPIMLDQKDNLRIVSHESDHIAYDFLGPWKPFWGLTAPDLYPADLREQIDQWIAETNSTLIAPLGKLSHQALPAEQRESLDQALKQLDSQLAKSDYLFSDQPTYADIRIYSHLQAGRLGDPQLLAPFPHLQRFFQRAWEDPQWTSEAERQVLDPHLASQNAKTEGGARQTEGAVAAGSNQACSLPSPSTDACAIPAPSPTEACSVPAPSTDACSL